MSLLSLAAIALAAQSGATPSPSLHACGFGNVLSIGWAANGDPVVQRLGVGALDGVPESLSGKFGTTDECKALSGGRLLVGSSGGGVAVVEEGRAVFAAGVPNAHSVEWLPGGRIASAASVNSAGNRLMVHDLATGKLVQEFPLPSAHGVVHDGVRSTLYALGMSELLAFDCNGQSGHLTLRERIPLPEGGSADGHDLRAVPRSAELLVTTAAHVWLFDRDLERFRLHPAIGRMARVKSVDIHPFTGRIAYVQADEGVWWSENVRFANPPGQLQLEGERFYKARWNGEGDGSGPPRSGGSVSPAGDSPPDSTAVTHDRPAHTRILFGSCADENEVTAAAWRRATALAPDAFVLLGDTPYIDSTDPAVQERRYREFSEFLPFADLVQATPMMGSVWDDHDFGRNDVDGKLKGKENSRAAFVAARSAAPFQPPYGGDDGGIYSSFRSGPVEVFLLDTRWFARTAPSEFDPQQPTLLGRSQWRWLRESLRASDAPFKVLACGMVWNGSVRPRKTDHWGAYPAEFKGLCQFLGEAKIEGVLLIGGDIHRPRVIRHDVAGDAGYPLLELISSPMHERVIGSAKVPHPGLLFDSGKGQVVLELSATEEELRATFHCPGEVLYQLRRRRDELAPR